jgi:PAS domain-containing protein
LWWLSAVCAIAVLRAALVWGYRRRLPDTWTTERWYRWALIGSTATGLAWGTSTLFLVPELPRADELLLLFVLTGMVAGAIPILSIAFPAFLLFNATVCMPVLLHLVLTGDLFHLALAGMTVLFVSATTYSAWNLNRAVLASVNLRIENQSLVSSLTDRSAAVERLNRELTKEIDERRDIEAALRTAQQDLERRIGQRTADLAEANHSLRQEAEERRRAERALFSSEQRFNHLTDNLNQGYGLPKPTLPRSCMSTRRSNASGDFPPTGSTRTPVFGETASIRMIGPTSTTPTTPRLPPPTGATWNCSTASSVPTAP